MIDVNVHLHHWPFRRLNGEDPPALVRSLRERSVTQAWVGSFDGIFHHDLSAANARLATDCKDHGAEFLIPFGSVNPALPGWQEDLRQCDEAHRMPGIRLHPGYHGYSLAAPALAELLAAAARRRMLVQIVTAIEDERTQHPLMRVPPVDLAPLPHVLKQVAGLRVVVLNAGRTPLAKQLSASGNVCLDIAMVEGVAGVAKLAADVTPRKLLFGSHAPFFYFEAAALKMKEADLSENDARAISETNARNLLEGRRS